MGPPHGSRGPHHSSPTNRPDHSQNLLENRAPQANEEQTQPPPLRFLEEGHCELGPENLHLRWQIEETVRCCTEESTPQGHRSDSPGQVHSWPRAFALVVFSLWNPLPRYPRAPSLTLSRSLLKCSLPCETIQPETALPAPFSIPCPCFILSHYTSLSGPRDVLLFIYFIVCLLLSSTKAGAFCYFVHFCVPRA